MELTDVLEGKRILVLEDEPLVAMLIEEMLLDLECVVIGPASTLGEAERLAEIEQLDAALLDVNVNGEMSQGVADILHARKVPYAFATGYGALPEMSGHAHAPVLQKPYPADKLQAVLVQLLGA